MKNRLNGEKTECLNVGYRGTDDGEFNESAKRHARTYSDLTFMDDPSKLMLAANELVPFDELIRSNKHLKFADLLLEVW